MFNENKFSDAEVKVNGSALKEIRLTENDIMHRASAWYGTTGSGKTFHVNYVLSTVYKKFPRVVLFSPTSEKSKDFEGKIPDILIINELSDSSFMTVYNQLVENSNIYREVNDLNNLIEFYKKYISANEQQALQTILTQKDAKISEINSTDAAIEFKRKDIKELTDKLDPLIIKFIKQKIAPFRKNLISKLSATNATNSNTLELKIVKYLDFNPNTLLIFDDCQNEINDILTSKGKNRDSNTALKNIFTRGRHDYITCFLLFQDDTTLKPFMRKAVKNSILTDPQIAAAFFNRDRSSANIDNSRKKEALEIVSKMFKGDKDYRKLVYRPNNTDIFGYSKAEEVGIFEMCSGIVKKYCFIIKNK